MRIRDTAPVFLFLLTYFISTYFGSILFLVGPQSARHIYTFYSGVSIPDLSGQQILRYLIILNIPIITFTLIYIITTHFMSKIQGVHFTGVLSGKQSEYWFWAVFSVWLLSIVVAAGSLNRGGAFGSIGAWLEYGSSISARWELFSSLTFFEFANIYVAIPITTAIFAVSVLDRSNSLSAFVLVSIPGLLVSLMLFQKKQPIIFMLIVMGGLAFGSKWGKRRKFLVFTCTIAICITLYLGALLAPEFSKKYNEIDSSIVPIIEYGDSSLIWGYGQNFTSSAKRFYFLISNDSTFAEFSTNYKASVSSTIRRVMFSINSIINRSAPTTLYYPIVFPDEHDFYGIDIPFISKLADDNRVVWAKMWPHIRGGTVAVPFNFALYAQVGIVGAIVWSGLLGSMIAVMWWIGKYQILPPSIRGAWLASTLVLCVYLAVDSFVNAFFVSYGLGWGFALIMGMAVLYRMLAWGQGASSDQADSPQVS